MAKRTKLLIELAKHRRQTDIFMKQVEEQNIAEDLLIAAGTPMTADQLTAVENDLSVTTTNTSWETAKTEYLNPTP